MLVLSRKTMGRICIGDSIRLTVLQIDRNHVRLAIEAPRDVVVLREELVKDAAGSAVEDAELAGAGPR